MEKITANGNAISVVVVGVPDINNTLGRNLGRLYVVSDP